MPSLVTSIEKGGVYIQRLLIGSARSLTLGTYFVFVLLFCVLDWCVYEWFVYFVCVDCLYIYGLLCV